MYGAVTWCDCVCHYLKVWFNWFVVVGDTANTLHSQCSRSCLVSCDCIRFPAVGHHSHAVFTSQKVFNALCKRFVLWRKSARVARCIQSVLADLLLISDIPLSLLLFIVHTAKRVFDGFVRLCGVLS